MLRWGQGGRTEGREQSVAQRANEQQLAVTPDDQAGQGHGMSSSWVTRGEAGVTHRVT